MPSMFPNRVFRFQVDGKPPAKGRPRGRNHYTPKATLEDEKRIRDAFLALYPEIRSDKRFSVEIKIYHWKRRMVDGDNVEKAILDALNKVLWENDRHVAQMWWMKFQIDNTEPEYVTVKALEL